MKIENTSLCAAISNKGVKGFQLFGKGLHGQDFMGFMSNLA